jgi:FkbM family methyltransferase
VDLRVHGDCVIRLAPSERAYGHDGLVYCFREAYEPGVRAAILAGVRPGDVVLDIGAHIGLWTLLMSRLVGPSGTVTAFEPVPRSADRLRHNLSASRAGAVDVVQAALGAGHGTVRMFIPGDAGSAALAPEGPFDETLVVPMITLDEYWVGRGSPDVSFVKVDAEGSEPRILEGAGRFFRSCRPIVACEVNAGKLGAMGHDPSELFAFFARLGYRSFVWDDRSRRFRESDPVAWGDVVFRPDRRGTRRHPLSESGCASAAPAARSGR